MTNRQWMRDTLAHTPTERIPYNFMFVPAVQRRLEAHYDTDDLAEYFDFPIRMTAPVSVKPLYADSREYGETIRDEFGIVWSTSELDRGSPIGPCLTGPDLSDYSFPDPHAAYRYAEIEEWCRANRDHFTVIWIGDLWERATFMRGMEHLLEDVALHPRFVGDLLEMIAFYILETMEVLLRRYEFDCVAVSDDYGSQKGLLMAPNMWRQLVKPCLASIYDCAKRYGRFVFHHSCGDIEPIIPDMIDMGLDILHPIQPEAMDIFCLKRNYGADLTLCGGLGTQHFLNRASPRQIREQVRLLKAEVGKGGGYVLEPGITVQVDVPKENLVAMIEEATQ